MVPLIEKQKFDGSWTLDEGLCGILNTGLQKIKDAAVVKVCRTDIKSNLLILSFVCTLKIISLNSVRQCFWILFLKGRLLWHALYYFLLIFYSKSNPVCF